MNWGLLKYSGVYAPLHPAPAFQINDFSYCLRRVFQTGSLWRQSDANRYSALRSHINCKAQPKRVNSVLRTSNNTRLVIVSLTLMAHFVKSTQNQKLYIYPCSLHKSRRKHFPPFHQVAVIKNLFHWFAIYILWTNIYGSCCKEYKEQGLYNSNVS